MLKNTFLFPAALLIIALFAISCDKDYDALGADIVGADHFEFTKYTDATIKSYNQKTGPAASNNLAVNPLGFYENPAFGNMHANFVTQLELGTVNPTFNNTDENKYDVYPTEIDSVILDIPYFSHLIKSNSDGSKEYELDSIYGVTPSGPEEENQKFKLSVYRSNYYLRNLDPNQELGEAQSYYTDMDGEIDNNKIPVLLNDYPITDTINKGGAENSNFFFDKREHVLKSRNDKKEVVLSRTLPSLRLHLSKEVFDDLILHAPSGQLADNATFKNYFRGLYFKAESLGNSANMAMINFKGGKITMYYNEDEKTGSGTDEKYKRVNKTLVFNLNGNTVSLHDNSNETPGYLNAINNPTQEASRLYLKGGEGAVTVIDIFTPEELEYLRTEQWMVNEASLTFYIDKEAMANSGSTKPEDQPAEPQRIFLYDLTNNKAIVDYVFDNTSNTRSPKNSKTIYGGMIETEDVNDGRGKRGTKYKIRVTNHIRTLIKNADVKNVRLGLSVTENINNVGFAKVKTANTNFDKIPTMSVMSPLGTILYGTASDMPDDKRLKLEIYYTKPN